MNSNESNLFTTQNMIKMGILGAVAVVLMQFDLSLPFLFPPFLKIDLGDVPAVVGLLVIHPLAGLIIPLIKVLLDLLIYGTTTGGVGEFSNYIISVAYLLPLIIIVHKNRSFKAILVGIVMGIFTTAVVGCLSNYFIVLPLYSKVIPIEQIIEMGTKLNPAIYDLKTFVIFIMGPFNAFKSTIVSLASLITVKAILPAMQVLRSKQA